MDCDQGDSLLAKTEKVGRPLNFFKGQREVIVKKQLSTKQTLPSIYFFKIHEIKKIK